MAKIILVVDDEPDIRKVLSFRLKKLGYDAVSASSGVEALRMAREKRPDLILLDYKMPDIDGLEIVRLIRSDDMLRSVPIVIISASSGENTDIEEARMKAGINDYIKKPFDTDEFIAMVKKYAGA